MLIIYEDFWRHLRRDDWSLRFMTNLSKLIKKTQQKSVTHSEILK